MCPTWGKAGQNAHGVLLAAVRDELRVEVAQVFEAAQADQRGAEANSEPT